MGITLLLFIKKERIDKLDHIFLRKNSSTHTAELSFNLYL